METTWVDPVALRAAAQRMDAAADIAIAILASQLDDLQFDGATAGRAHIAAGGSVRTGVDLVVADMVRWAGVARETSAALRAGADLYADVESRAVADLR